MYSITTGENHKWTINTAEHCTPTSISYSLRFSLSASYFGALVYSDEKQLHLFICNKMGKIKSADIPRVRNEHLQMAHSE